MLMPGTTDIRLVAPKNMQGHKNFWSDLCGKSMIINRTKKLQDKFLELCEYLKI